MSKYATGKHSKAISDRSGMEFPYKEMVREWNGSFVHYTEFEPKQPQLEPKPIGGDGIAFIEDLFEDTHFGERLATASQAIAESSVERMVTLSEYHLVEVALFPILSVICYFITKTKLLS